MGLFECLPKLFGECLHVVTGLRDGAARVLTRALRPHGFSPWIILSLVVLLDASNKILLTAVYVLLAIPAELPLPQPLCSCLSAAAAWDLLDGHPSHVRWITSVYMMWWCGLPCFCACAGANAANQ